MEEKPEYLERTRLKLQQARAVVEKQDVSLCNQSFVVYPNVFNPNIFFGTEFLANELISIISEFSSHPPNILEIGGGAGYMAILAVLNGASRATCTDINTDALKNMEENASKHQLSDRITIKYSDVFSGLNSTEKFDLIFWNYPFGHIDKPVEELEPLERALMDPYYKSLDVYLRHADEYLSPHCGRLFIGFSVKAGCQRVLEDMAEKHRWCIRMRNETQSQTTPVMQIGMYELVKNR